MIPQLIIAFAIAAVCGFLCLTLYRAAEFIRNYRVPGGRRVPARPVAAPAEPPTVEEFKEQVKNLEPFECSQCGTMLMPDAKMCTNCGYAPPINFRTARKSFTSIRRQLENQENPPTLPRKHKTL